MLVPLISHEKWNRPEPPESRSIPLTISSPSLDSLQKSLPSSIQQNQLYTPCTVGKVSLVKGSSCPDLGAEHELHRSKKRCPQNSFTDPPYPGAIFTYFAEKKAIHRDNFRENHRPVTLWSRGDTTGLSGFKSGPEKGESDRWCDRSFINTGPGRYDQGRKRKPDLAPDSRFPIPPHPGKPRKPPRLGSRGKRPQIRPRLSKYTQFRCQITARNRVWTADLFATSKHPCDPGIGRRNAAK